MTLPACHTRGLHIITQKERPSYLYNGNPHTISPQRPSKISSQRAQYCRKYFHVITSSWYGNHSMYGLSQWETLHCNVVSHWLSPYTEWYLMIYSQTSNIRCTKSQYLNVSPLVLQLALPNPLKPGVKSGMKMKLRQQVMLKLHLSDQQFYCLLSFVW